VPVLTDAPRDLKPLITEGRDHERQLRTDALMSSAPSAPFSAVNPDALGFQQLRLRRASA
jgi:hypothetical protein